MAGKLTWITTSGIKLAKLKGVYKGRTEGSKEDTLAFLSKEKNNKAVQLLKKGYKANEVSNITGLHVNTITKIKKVGSIHFFKAT